MDEKPPTIVALPTSTRIGPSGILGETGQDLWRRVMAEYDIADCGGREMLFQACSAADRASQLKAQIDRDGAVIRSRGGIRAHPALKEELACRSFVVKALRLLGLDVEPLKTIGRPGAGVGWVPPRCR
jgi:hypothetical protein